MKLAKGLLWAALAVVLVGAAAFAYIYFAGGSGDPSTDLTTPTIASGSTTTSSGADPASGTTAFVIDPARSVATFHIDEVLRGNPQTATGSTSELAGQLEFDPDDLSTVEFSQILINARTLQTDSGNRDRAIRTPIVLNSASDEFEFITFDVTSVDGLPAAATVGEELTFTISGDLTIKGTTNPVTFEVTATMTDPQTLEGSASATVLRNDYAIGIPNAPGVADVSDEVTITLDFVASSA